MIHSLLTQLSSIMKVITLLFLAGVAYGQKCIHTNAQNNMADQTVNQMLIDVDKNNNGMVEDSELLSEFVTPMDTDGSFSVSRAEFVAFWPKKYHDNAEMAKELFDCIDPDHNGSLNLFDIGPLKSMVERETGGVRDGKISTLEFTEFLLQQCYTRCQFQPA